MSAAADTAAVGSRVGERVELGRYRIGTVERLIVGQRVNGVVRVSDVPATGRGRAYLIERELEQDGNDALQALVEDYLDQVKRHGRVPIEVPIERYLEDVPRLPVKDTNE